MQTNANIVKVKRPTRLTKKQAWERKVARKQSGLTGYRRNAAK